MSYFSYHECFVRAPKKQINQYNKLHNESNRKPDDKDLKATIRLLNSFKLHMQIQDIPDLATMSELMRWRKSVIDKCIS